MSLADALILAAVGFVVVFIALGLIALFIMLMAKLVSPMQGNKTPAPAAKPAPVMPVVKPAPVASGNRAPLSSDTSIGSIDLHTVSDRDAALIMAIVADTLQAPLNTLVFKSIKEA